METGANRRRRLEVWISSPISDQRPLFRRVALSAYLDKPNCLAAESRSSASRRRLAAPGAELIAPEFRPGNFGRKPFPRHLEHIRSKCVLGPNGGGAHKLRGAVAGGDHE
jgi:hypothetical protein